MNGRYRIIDEVNYNLVGTFDTLESAVDYVATLLEVNDDLVDELTIANDEGGRLTGDSLRTAVNERVKPREHVTALSDGTAMVATHRG